MTPRDVQDYEAQVLNVVRRWEDGEGGLEDEIAAALRAESRAALERAAQELADMKCANIQKQGGKIRHSESLIGGIEIAQAVLRRRIAAAKRDLAPAPESPPTTDPIHEAYLAADEYGQPPVAPAPDLRDLLKQAADMLRSRASTDEDRAYVACFDTALASPDPRDQRIAEPEPPYWRNGRHYGIHVYRGEVPIATFHTVEAAQAAVRAYNAGLDRSAPAPDLAAQLDELSNALAPYADAETGAKWDRLRAAVGARDQRMAALEAAVRWALGEEGEFRTREPGEGAYWWRTELRRKAALAARPGAATGEEG